MKELMNAEDRGIPQEMLESAECALIIPGAKKGACIREGNLQPLKLWDFHLTGDSLLSAQAVRHIERGRIGTSRVQGRSRLRFRTQ